MYMYSIHYMYIYNIHDDPHAVTSLGRGNSEYTILCLSLNDWCIKLAVTLKWINVFRSL